jgi:hypothetical protein
MSEMLPGKSHLSENEFALAANGELTARRQAEVSEHLRACWICRERMHSLEETINDFVRARGCDLNAQVPPIAGPRALLRARMADTSTTESRARVRGFAFPAGSLARLASAGAVCAAVVLAALVIFGSSVNAEGPKPLSGVTPGETRPITIAEVCRNSEAEVVGHDISEDTRAKVFAAYGIQYPRVNQFEVDYLITPDLGGTRSIRNLWPQPYSARWNARVKDRLEQRLHQLVCAGKLDLTTAQHDIAVDWIGAYRKYVGAE